MVEVAMVGGRVPLVLLGGRPASSADLSGNKLSDWKYWHPQRTSRPLLETDESLDAPSPPALSVLPRACFIRSLPSSPVSLVPADCTAARGRRQTALSLDTTTAPLLYEHSRRTPTVIFTHPFFSGTSCGASTATLSTAALSLVHSTAEYCASTWLNSNHIPKVDTELNSNMCLITSTMKTTPTQWLPVLPRTLQPWTSVDRKS